MSTISYGELDGLILRMFNKTPENRGFYTAQKVEDAVQEALTYIATRAFIIGQGWQNKVALVTTAANQRSVPINPAWAMIKAVRYLAGSEYVVLDYDDNPRQSEWSAASGMTQSAYRYRIVDNYLYFNPVLAEGGTDYLEVEYVTYPKVPESETDAMPFHLTDTFKEFTKYHAGLVLFSDFEKGRWNKQDLYTMWHDNMIAMLEKRTLTGTFIRDALP